MRQTRKVILAIALLCAPSWAAITHIKSQGTSAGTSGVSATFSFTSTNTGDGVTFFIGCAASAPSTTTLTATGWTTHQAGTTLAGGAAGSMAAFWAYAPNTTAATFTATFNTGCNSFFFFGVDEWQGMDLTSVVDTQNSATGSGSPTVSITPGVANAAVVAGVLDSITAVGTIGGSAATKGGDDTGGDWTVYRILSGGSGVSQTVSPTGSGTYVIYTMTIKPAAGGGGGGTARTLMTLGAG